MNFTKQYIELCKNDKVQGLRKKLEHGDWFFDLDAEEFEKKINIMTNDIDDINFGDSFVWLPTGDQLDQCIVDICKKHKWFYKVTFYASMTTCEIFPPEQEYEIAIHSQDSFNNPLICKLKLLLSLLESEE